jgi:hypothetical protein
MKTRRVVAGLVIAGIGIGALLNAVLPDFNLGWGSGGGIGNPPASNTTTTAIAPVATGPISQPIKDADPSDVAGSTEQVPAPKTVYVLIDGREYLLRRGSEGKYEPATLDEVVEAAQAATGDDVGIRVRIEQKSSSRELAERALRQKLEEVGIPRDSVRWKDEPVDTAP